MSHFSQIIFDLDGTLTDNTQGINNSIQYALKQMQFDNIPEEIPDQFIGPPLQWGFKNIFGLNDRNTKLAVQYFREYYEENGWHENIPYSGVSEMLEELYLAGKQMFLATSKLEKYARRIVEHFEFEKYISQLKGADYSGKNATKSGLITELLTINQLTPSKEIIMVGDTVFDIEGGKDNGLATIAVTYGFGKEYDLQKSEPDFLIDNVDELFEILI